MYDDVTAPLIPPARRRRRLIWFAALLGLAALVAAGVLAGLPAIPGHRAETTAPTTVSPPPREPGAPPVGAIPLEPVPVDLPAGGFPVAEDAYRRAVSLPLFPGMSERDVDDVCAAVRKVVAHFKR